MTFNTFTTFDPWVSLVSQRLYVAEMDKETLAKTVLASKHGFPYERKGLGFTQYFSFVGPIFKMLGIALKTTNEKNETIYINKSSFSHFILRVKQATLASSGKSAQVDILKVNDLYHYSKISSQKIRDQNKIIESRWDSSKNIQQLIYNFLKI